MRPELEAARAGVTGVRVRYLDQALHRSPDLLGERLQEALDEVPCDVEEVVLGYGLCAGGAAGLRAPKQGLAIPRVHDCISLFLGSREAYEEAFDRRCGTYYLTPGWVSEGKDPLGMLEEDYVPRVGREDAVWALHEELKHYTHLALIDTGVADPAPLRERAEENARFLNKELVEVPGSLRLFRQIVGGPLDGGEFVCVGPGETVDQDAFF